MKMNSADIKFKTDLSISDEKGCQVIYIADNTGKKALFYLQKRTESNLSENLR